MEPKFLDYEEELIKSLQDPAEALEYLNAALMDEDPRVFLLALKHVLKTQNVQIAQLAKKSNLNRENLYRILSQKGNPKLTSIISVLNTLGLQLAVQPSKPK